RRVRGAAPGRVAVLQDGRERREDLRDQPHRPPAPGLLRRPVEGPRARLPAADQVPAQHDAGPPEDRGRALRPARRRLPPPVHPRKQTGFPPVTPGERPVRLAVIGVGHLGRHHARAGAPLPGVEVAGVLDPHNGWAEAAAREFGLKTLADLAAVASVAEAAVVATPTVSHAEIASELLEKGVDVLVEKPMTASLEEADGLVALARAKGRILAVGHIERHNPAVEAAMTLAPSPVFV